MRLIVSYRINDYWYGAESVQSLAEFDAPQPGRCVAWDILIPPGADEMSITIENEPSKEPSEEPAP